MDIKEKIHQTVTGNGVVLYMKGSPQSPQCGFSSRAVQILNACGVKNFTSVDVLADSEVRQGIKDYSNWPTVPQLYIAGEFVGGRHMPARRALAESRRPATTIIKA